MSGTIVPSTGSTAQRLPRLPMHAPIVEDHGLFAEHDMACAVCGINKAMLAMNNGVFWPCDTCRQKGWELGRIRYRWLQRWFHNNFAHRSRR